MTASSEPSLPFVAVRRMLTTTTSEPIIVVSVNGNADLVAIMSDGRCSNDAESARIPGLVLWASPPEQYYAKSRRAASAASGCRQASVHCTLIWISFHRAAQASESTNHQDTGTLVHVGASVYLNKNSNIMILRASSSVIPLGRTSQRLDTPY